MIKENVISPYSFLVSKREVPTKEESKVEVKILTTQEQVGGSTTLEGTTEETSKVAIPCVFNKHDEKTKNLSAVYVGRGSPWGNPFVIGKHCTREQAILLHKQHLLSQLIREGKGSGYFKDRTLKEMRTYLKGRNLRCFCAPQACHADLLLLIANAPDPKAVIRTLHDELTHRNPDNRICPPL